MYSGIESFGGVGQFGVVVCMYYVVLFICGNCILKNLFEDSSQNFRRFFTPVYRLCNVKTVVFTYCC